MTISRNIQSTPSNGVRSILLVDDDTASTDSLTDILTGEGYSVATARNGKEALNHLRGQPSPGLIILDLFMPEMDGWEFRRAQLSDTKLRDIPVVVMTGASIYAGIDANVIVHKPLDVARFVSLIERYF
ncbi:MAG TPA: response regulator [Candidatus Binataceae bacterium]|nr:response regulator [Candidatus Binataceae bacterium]